MDRKKWSQRWIFWLPSVPLNVPTAMVFRLETCSGGILLSLGVTVGFMQVETVTFSWISLVGELIGYSTHDF